MILRHVKQKVLVCQNFALYRKKNGKQRFEYSATLEKEQGGNKIIKCFLDVCLINFKGINKCDT